MSCQDFDSVSVELARGSLIDAATRESALAHANACASCAGRLRQEQALSVALREVSASMCEREAPARVEGALLAAFRVRRAATPVVTFESARARRAASGFATLNRRALVSAVVAASLIVACVVAWRALSAKTHVVDETAQTPTINTDKATDTTIMQTPAVVPASIDQRAASNGLVSRPTIRHAAARSVVRQRNSTDALPIVFTEHAGRVYADGASTNGASDPGASADFVPLITADSSVPLESGQMVRVQIPRAALAAWGLPVNAERAGEMVKADLLLAHDGTARAIRLRP